VNRIDPMAPYHLTPSTMSPLTSRALRKWRKTGQGRVHEPHAVNVTRSAFQKLAPPCVRPIAVRSAVGAGLSAEESASYSWHQPPFAALRESPSAWTKRRTVAAALAVEVESDTN
jgi:hypothetical protein